MVCFFGMMVGTAGVGFRLFQGVSRLRNDGFFAPVFAPDGIVGVARLALVARCLRTRGVPPAWVDKRSLFIDRVFRGGVYFARCVPLGDHQLKPRLGSVAGSVGEVREGAVASRFEELLDVD